MWGNIIGTLFWAFCVFMLLATVREFNHYPFKIKVFVYFVTFVVGLGCLGVIGDIWGAFSNA